MQQSTPLPPSLCERVDEIEKRTRSIQVRLACLYSTLETQSCMNEATCIPSSNSIQDVVSATFFNLTNIEDFLTRLENSIGEWPNLGIKGSAPVSTRSIH